MKIKLSALVSDARGKLNGSYMARSQHGLVLRNKITPKNPQSSKQQSHRNVFSWVGRLWNKLTEEQREQWREYAQTQPFNNDFNDRQYLTGNALFIQRNMNLYSAGLPPQTTPSNKVVVFPPINAHFLYAIGNEYIIEIKNEIPTDYYLNIYASPPHSISAIKKETSFRLIATIKEDNLILRQYNIFDDYKEVFGVAPANANVDLRFQFLAPNGKLSLPTFDKTNITPPPPIIIGLYITEEKKPYEYVLQFEIDNVESLKHPAYALYVTEGHSFDFCPFGPPDPTSKVTLPPHFFENQLITIDATHLAGACIRNTYYTLIEEDKEIISKDTVLYNPEGLPDE